MFSQRGNSIGVMLSVTPTAFSWLFKMSEPRTAYGKALIWASRSVKPEALPAAASSCLDLLTSKVFTEVSST